MYLLEVTSISCIITSNIRDYQASRDRMDLPEIVVNCITTPWFPPKRASFWGSLLGTPHGLNLKTRVFSVIYGLIWGSTLISELWFADCFIVWTPHYYCTFLLLSKLHHLINTIQSSMMYLKHSCVWCGVPVPSTCDTHQIEHCSIK